MSMKTWKEEFYPVGADEAAKGGNLAAVEHSIKKWEGLTLENLAAHGVRQHEDAPYVITGPEGLGPGDFPLSMGTCALCEIFALRGRECHGCPLYDVRGAKCFKDGKDEAPYNAFCEEYPGRPGPMIEALKAARELVLRTANASGGAIKPTPEAKA